MWCHLYYYGCYSFNIVVGVTVVLPTQTQILSDFIYFLSPSLYCFCFVFFFVFLLLSPSPPHHHRHRTLALHLSPHNFISTQSPSLPTQFAFRFKSSSPNSLASPFNISLYFLFTYNSNFPYFLPSLIKTSISISLSFSFFYYFLLSCLLV